jgi:hypothetical protein
MSESEDKKRKDKKEKKAKKEKKKAKDAASRRPMGLEEVHEDEYEDRQYDEDGAALDMDDLDGPQPRSGRRQAGHANGGMELEDEEQLDADILAEMDAQAAELDLDYHPPPPKTTQQVVLAGISFLILGIIEIFLFVYLSNPMELWSLVTSACCLLITGIFGLRAANDNQISSAQHYRFAIQVYVVLVLLLSTINIIISNTEPCIAPCISTTPCTTPPGATTTCAHQLVVGQSDTGDELRCVCEFLMTHLCLLLLVVSEHHRDERLRSVLPDLPALPAVLPRQRHPHREPAESDGAEAVEQLGGCEAAVPTGGLRRGVRRGGAKVLRGSEKEFPLESSVWLNVRSNFYDCGHQPRRMRTQHCISSINCNTDKALVFDKIRCCDRE